MDRKNALFILGIIFAVVFALSLKGPHAVRNPYDNVASNTCDKTSTTTDCDKISSSSFLELSQPFGPQPVVYENKEAPTLLLYPNSFGPLRNVYEDKDLGFSLRYPDEIRVSESDCTLLNDKYSDGTFAIKICNQNSQLSFYNPDSRSLDEYKNDYILKTEKEREMKRIYIRKNEEITTDYGTKGLKQVIDVEVFDSLTGTSTSEMRDAFLFNQVRYVFYNHQKGMAVLLMFRGIPDLKEAIIQSISF